MLLAEALRQAFRQLWAHRARSALTLFGLVWGTASVILLVSWGEGMNKMIARGFERTGKNLGHAWAGRVSESYTPAVDRRFLWFERKDLAALRARSRLTELVSGETRSHLALAYRQTALNVETRGLEPESFPIRGVSLDSGRPLSHADLEHRRRVVVLGHKLRRRLLGGEEAVGSWIRMDGKPFEVVGVLARVGEQLNRDGDLIDDQAWIPFTTHHALWPRPWTEDEVVGTIIFRMVSADVVDDVEDEVRAILAERLRVSPNDDEAVALWSPVTMLRQLPLEQQKVLLLILAAGTLIIGGVGTLTMMIDAVHERRREIGVRLAVGARRSDVVLQFFIETVAIVIAGGIFGALLGVLATLALASVDAPDLIPVPELSGDVILLAFAVLGSVALAAGVIPAWRASRIDPSLTLRED